MNVFFQTYKPLHTLADTIALSYTHNEGFLPNVRYITHTCLYHHTKLHTQGRFLSEHVNRHTLSGNITLSYTHYAGFFFTTHIRPTALHPRIICTLPSLCV